MGGLAIFTETPFVNPYVSSIADAMLRPAEARANALQHAAQAQANAQLVKGQAWGQAAQTIGQTVGAIPQQIQQAKVQEQEQTVRDAQIAELKRQAAGRQLLSSLIKQHGDDNDAIAKGLTVGGFPEQGQSWLKTSMDAKESLAKFTQSQQAFAQHQNELIGDLAFAAKTPDDFASSLGVLARAGVIDEKTAHQMADQIATDPKAAAALVQKYLPFSPKYQAQQAELNKPQKLGAGDTIVIPGQLGPDGHPKVVASGPPKKPSTRTELAADAANPNSPTRADSQAALDLLAKGQAPNSQEAEFELPGMGRVKGDYIPGQNGQPGRYFYNGKEVTGQVKGNTPQSPQPQMQWAKDPKTGDVRLMTNEEIQRIGAKQPDTADMRNKAEGRTLVSKSIDAIEAMGRKIITKVGPEQRLDAIKRGADAVFGNDPEFKTYQDARMALAGNLAVAQQGSRPSDADIKSIWLPLVPDAYVDTSESNDLKWSLIRTMSNVPPSEQVTLPATLPKGASVTKK